jgi:hypothetical protein
MSPPYILAALMLVFAAERDEDAAGARERLRTYHHQLLKLGRWHHPLWWSRWGLRCRHFEWRRSFEVVDECLWLKHAPSQGFRTQKR